MNRKLRKYLIAGLALLLLIDFSSAHAANIPAGAFKKVTIVIFENTNYQDAMAQPFLKKLTQSGALLANFYAQVHPSQGNYIALTSGSTYNVLTDRPVNLDVRHIGNLLEAKNLTWKVYAEAYPGNCFLGTVSGNYVRKHVPFLSYIDVQNSAERCGKIVEAAQFSRDLQNATLPNYALYIPDMNNDGHDTGVTYASRWLEQKFGPLLQDPKFMQDMLFVLTFDESATNGGNHIYTVLVGNNVKPGIVSNIRYTHYSLLRTIEDSFGIGSLQQLDESASSIADIWQ